MVQTSTVTAILMMITLNPLCFQLVKAESSGVDLASSSPHELLQNLLVLGASKYPYVLIKAPIVHWINDTDLPDLIRRRNSKAKCASVATGLSSDFPEHPSTEGAQASFMIYGFIKGVYPSEPSSEHAAAYMSEVDKWVENWRRTHKTTSVVPTNNSKAELKRRLLRAGEAMPNYLLIPKQKKGTAN